MTACLVFLLGVALIAILVMAHDSWEDDAHNNEDYEED